jgi:hypothetical protein
MPITVSELGVLLFVLFALFYWLRIFADLTAVIGLLGVVLIGTSGWIGRVLGDVATWVAHLAGTLTANVLGSAFEAALFIGLAVVFIHDLHPKHQSGRRTQQIGIGLGALIAAGVTGIPALSGVHAAIVSTAGNVISIL